MPTRRFTAISCIAFVNLLCACAGTAPYDAGDASVGGHPATTGGASGFGGKTTTDGGTAGAGGTMICCNGMPVCGSGEVQVASLAACPANAQCRSISMCCTTIWCARVDDAGACNPSTEYNRHYVATSPSQCEVIDYTCPANTAMFGNACGCGCQQDANCQQYVDCEPGTGTVNSMCSDYSQCPYTTRLF